MILMKEIAKHTKLLLFLILLFAITTSNYAQKWKLRRYEIGGGITGSQLFGDIGGSADLKNFMGLKDIQLSETRGGLDFTTRYKIKPQYSVKTSLHGVFEQGDDIKSTNIRGRAYKTWLFEFSGQFEYYLVKEERTFRSAGMYNRRGMLNNFSNYAIYTFGGLGLIYSRSSHDKGTIIPENDFYKSGNLGAVIPLGLGVKYIIDSRYSVNTEFGYRIALSDYVEGYHNINSKFFDVYYFLDLTLTYRLKTTPRNIPAFLDRRYKKYGY
jgi:hypothetical protein